MAETQHLDLLLLWAAVVVAYGQTTTHNLGDQVAALDQPQELGTVLAVPEHSLISQI
jgi:hypothetical protein